MLSGSLLSLFVSTSLTVGFKVFGDTDRTQYPQACELILHSSPQKQQ
jgi:hypothetical protein